MIRITRKDLKARRGSALFEPRGIRVIPSRFSPAAFPITPTADRVVAGPDGKTKGMIVPAGHCAVRWIPMRAKRSCGSPWTCQCHAVMPCREPPVRVPTAPCPHCHGRGRVFGAR